ncbi:hypothetical protein M758_1G265700 [Ceratodon purpureus]|nr:hypothetical protein M758_1G265700 [Ceratodon purpureus]
MGLDHRTSPCVAAMAPRATRGSTRQSVWSGGVGRGKGRRLAGPVRAMGDETMWITATSAVALVVALAAFAALGGYLLSMGVDNEERSEEEKIEKLKEQGLYEKPEPTRYEDQGIATRTRKRRISEE